MVKLSFIQLIGCGRLRFASRTDSNVFYDLIHTHLSAHVQYKTKVVQAQSCIKLQSIVVVDLDE